MGFPLKINSVAFIIAAAAHVLSLILVFEFIDSSPFYLILLLFGIVEFSLFLFVGWLKYQHDMHMLPKTISILAWVVDILFWLEMFTILFHNTNLYAWLISITWGRQFTLAFFIVTFIALHLFLKYYHFTARLNKPHAQTDGEQPQESNGSTINVETKITIPNGDNGDYGDKLGTVGTNVTYESLPQHDAFIPNGPRAPPQEGSYVQEQQYNNSDQSNIFPNLYVYQPDGTTQV